MLKLEDVYINYGHVNVIKGVSMDIPEKQITLLLGSNGAGKSTILKAISGLLKVSKGNITLEGKKIQNSSPSAIVRKGIAHVAEGKKIFHDQTVLANLQLGAFLRRDKNEVQQDINYYMDKFPVLKKKIKHKAGSLSGGEQQIMAIAQALLSRPKVLMLDEPSLGLAPLIVEEIMNNVYQLRQEGITILLVEQIALQALDICDQGYILENGSIVMEGNREFIKENIGDLKTAYLGKH